jgi:NAD(P)H-hydrate epimerase
MNVPVHEVRGEREVRQLAQSLTTCNLAVDALLGTGLAGRVRGVYARLIQTLNEATCPTVSVDIPSGIDSDNGNVLGPAVRAVWTVTLALPKRGIMLHPGADYAGDVIVGDIGIPRSLLDAENVRCHLATPDQIAFWLPARKSTAHKGDFGRVLIVGGSAAMAGAAILAARAALRGGCGLCTVALPESANLAAKAAVLEATTVPLPETVDHSIAEHAMYSFESFTRRMNVMAIGPGLTRNPETANFVRRLVEQARLPAVIDADGIAAWNNRRAELKRVRTAKVLTPHPGEMAELMGATVESIQRDRITTALRCANECNAIVVLKGARTVIAHPNGDLYINPTGNPGMATGGSGDVLTGLIASLMAQGMTPMMSAVAAAYLHGLAGDIAANHVGRASLIAGDLIEWLPEAWKSLSRLHERNLLGPRLYRVNAYVD